VHSFSIAAPEILALFDTASRHDAHLKRLTLAAAERMGDLEIIQAKTGRRRNSYPPGTQMRFVR
jgi:hypothetical protein